MPAHSRSKNGVASLAYVAGIHVLTDDAESKTWMAGTSPAMTRFCPYFAACSLSAARSASLRKFITATLLVRE
jgi:hypothetical protein